MNNIKSRFRVFDLNEKCYRSRDEDWCINQNGELLFNGKPVKQEDFFIDQSTDEFDADDNLIYEGDIVEVSGFKDTKVVEGYKERLRVMEGCPIMASSETDTLLRIGVTPSWAIKVVGQEAIDDLTDK